MSGSTADHSHFTLKLRGCKVGRADPSPTLKLEAWNSSQKDVPWGPWSFSAVESAFQVRKKPAYSGIKESAPWVWASVTRRMREPNVGSLIIELAGPRAGARGDGLASGSESAGQAEG